MPLSPEIRKIPELIGKFNRAGLTSRILLSLIKGETGRDLIEDARRLVEEHGSEFVETSGIENIPQDTGCLLAFNHPNIDVLLPAMLALMVKIYDVGGQTPTLLMSSEIPLLGKYNETSPLPGSIRFIRRFQRMYRESIIPVPISASRPDYQSGRFSAVRMAVAALYNGNVVMVAPEGHSELGNTISPVETFHPGSGGLARMAARLLMGAVPVAIWEEAEGGSIRVKIGSPFLVSAKDDNEAVYELMSRVAGLMPQDRRGPFT